MALQPVKNGQITTKKSRKRNSDNRMIQAEPGEMSRFIRHSLWSYYEEPIDISDPKQVEQRINDYFQHCMEDDMKPTVMGICNSLGITRATFHEWCSGGRRADTHVDIIRKAKNFLEEMMESYMLNGKINPVTGIFLLKNNFGYQDKQEVVLKPSMDLGEETSPEELKHKYLEATGQIVGECEEIG